MKATVNSHKGVLQN